MNTQVHPTRNDVDGPDPIAASNPGLVKKRDRTAIQPLLDRDATAPEDSLQVEPLWMITVAGALLFVFLAVAAALD